MSDTPPPLPDISQVLARVRHTPPLPPTPLDCLADPPHLQHQLQCYSPGKSAAGALSLGFVRLLCACLWHFVLPYAAAPPLPLPSCLPPSLMTAAAAAATTIVPFIIIVVAAATVMIHL